MKKHLQFSVVVIFSTLLIQNNVFAQTKIKYGYDNTGNRQSRHLIILTSDTTSSATAQTEKSAKDQKVFSETVGDKKILIYPNPTKGQLLIEIQGYDKEDKTLLYLYNLSGNLMINSVITENSIPLDLSGYSPGTYILKLTLGNKTSEWKIVKE
ncbi:MAG TPA: T9SS type A sorting domain-containing protein [Bacteroidales bacterium]